MVTGLRCRIPYSGPSVLPKEKRNVDEVERQLRRVVDRALRDLREDFDNFFGKEEQ